MDEGIISELKRLGIYPLYNLLVNGEGAQRSYNGSPETQKSRISRFSKRDNTPDTRTSRGHLDSELQNMKASLKAYTQKLIKEENEKSKNDLISFIKEIIF